MESKDQAERGVATPVEETPIPAAEQTAIQSPQRDRSAAWAEWSAARLRTARGYGTRANSSLRNMRKRTEETFGGPGLQTRGLAFAASAVALLIIVNSIIAYRSVREVQDREQLVAHTHLVQGQLQTVQSTLTDAETGERGYLLVGDSTYLRPYQVARAQVSGQITQLQTDTADNPIQQQRIAQLKPLVAQLFTQLDRAVTAKQAGDTATAAQPEVSGQVQRSMASIRGILNQMNATETTLLTGRDEQARDALTATTVTFVAAALTDIALLAGVFILLRRGFEQRERLAMQAAELQATFEAMPDGIAVYDKHGAVQRQNAAAQRILGAEYVPAEPPNERIPTDPAANADTGQLPVGLVLAGETFTGEHSLDVQMPAEGGQERELDVSGTPIRDAEGRITGGVLVLRDMTERRKLEQRTQRALEAMLAMAQSLVDLPDGSEATDERPPAQSGAVTEHVLASRLATLTCDVLGCNRVGITAIEPGTQLLRAVAVVGLAPDVETRWWAEQHEQEAKGIRFGEGADPEQLAQFVAGNVMVLDMTQPPFNELPNPYGVTTNLVAPMRVSDRMVGMISLDYGGPPHAFTADEIALAGAVAQLSAVVLERDRLLRERAEAQASVLALRAANQQMDAFLSIASHELRTPMTTLKVNLQLISRRLRQLSKSVAQTDPSVAGKLVPLIEPVQQSLSRSELAVARQERLVDDLLDVSRIQSGRLEMRSVAMDLAAEVLEVVEEQRAHQPGRAIRLAVPEGDVPIVADTDRIGQVVTNYLTNAIKYSPQEEPIEVTLEQVDGAARLSVRDFGPGIPVEEQQHLWDRFYRVPGVEVQAGGSGVGLGLGLYICREIIERHGGTVGVESVPGEGSTFWFTIPLAANEA